MLYHRIISSWTLTLRVLFGRTMLLITTTSSSTVTASPALQNGNRQMVQCMNLRILFKKEGKLHRKLWTVPSIVTPSFALQSPLAWNQLTKLRKSIPTISWIKKKEKEKENHFLHKWLKKSAKALIFFFFKNKKKKKDWIKQHKNQTSFSKKVVLYM